MEPDEFWESSFQQKNMMWGYDPADSAVHAATLFAEHSFKDILIPGIGYGRNARPFLDVGMNVTGIEISQTAIDMAQKIYGEKMRIFHGSINEMPYDAAQYDGIFSYALIHLLNEAERNRFHEVSYSQLRPGGIMVLVTIADTAPMFATGKKLTERLYETRPGVRLFFYDEASIKREFGSYGLQLVRAVAEPTKHAPESAPLDYIWIECHKPRAPHNAHVARQI